MRVPRRLNTVTSFYQFCLFFSLLRYSQVSNRSVEFHLHVQCFRFRGYFYCAVRELNVIYRFSQPNLSSFFFFGVHIVQTHTHTKSNSLVLQLH
jgi:hypothetical protein